MSRTEENISSKSKKVKMLCCHGGDIKFPAVSSNGKLGYDGGCTHLISVSVDISYGKLVRKIRSIHGLHPYSYIAIQYYLPIEDLLISVTCDEDMENMMEEFLQTTEKSFIFIQ